MTKWKHFLAWIDDLFGWEQNSIPGHCGAASEKSYWTFWGRKFAIFDKKGQLLFLGNSWWTLHLFDENKKLIDRVCVVNLVGPTDRIVYNLRDVYRAYRQQL